MRWRRVRSVIDDWQLRRAVASFEQHQRRFESRPPRAPERLSLAEYGELLAGVPTPSLEQLRVFAQYVGRAHSWYKHLRLIPPGQPMTFFLDPAAGARRIIGRDGRLRLDESPLEPDCDPTADYRRDFGYAAYSRGPESGTIVSFIGSDFSQNVPSDTDAVVFDRSRGELVALPDDVLEAGTAFVSGSVHHRASCFVWWKFLLELETDPDRDLSFVEWPEESGGSAAWAEIAARIKALNADPSLVEELPGHRALPPNDLVLYRLLEPERERELRSMVAALERVLELLGRG